MKTPLLSILIPTVTERFSVAQKLIEKLVAQDKDSECEILWSGDNRKRTIGAKRNGLLSLARGQFVAFVDDDDDVAEDYVQSILEIIRRNHAGLSVITFLQSVIWNGTPGKVHFSLKHTDEGFIPNGTTKRFPWHVCAWQKDLAQSAVFTEKQWGEDADWVRQMVGKGRIEAHVPRVLHHYKHGAGSLAF